MNGYDTSAPLEDTSSGLLGADEAATINGARISNGSFFGAGSSVALNRNDAGHSSMRGMQSRSAAPCKITGPPAARSDDTAAEDGLCGHEGSQGRVNLIAWEYTADRPRARSRFGVLCTGARIAHQRPSLWR
jgi:hypothetical protein